MRHGVFEFFNFIFCLKQELIESVSLRGTNRIIEPIGRLVELAHEAVPASRMELELS